MVRRQAPVLTVQFDIHRNPDPASHTLAPYLLDIQTDLLDHLSTRVAVPLIRRNAMTVAERLHPIFTVEGHEVVMATADLAAIRRTDMGERVGSLAERRDDIVAAVDFLITGI